jgi:HK97 gp10 family phage protein
MEFRVDASDFDRAAAVLQRFPEKLRGKVLELAAAAGAQVIVQAARARAPVSGMKRGTTRGWKRSERYRHTPGQMKRSIRVRVVSRALGTVVLSVKPQNRRAFYWWFVEKGTRPHAVHSRAVSLSGRTARNRTTKQHPGMRAKPFLFPAADAAGPAAVQATRRILLNAVAELQRELDRGH